MSILGKLLGGSSPLAPLTKQLDALGKKQMIMPIEIFQLANAFVEYPDGQAAVETLLQTKYADHSNMYVRRVVIIALRRKQVFDNPAVVGLMYQKLSDPNPWAAYDAAWYFKEANIKDDKIRQKLVEIAGDKAGLSADALKQLSDEHLSDADVRLQIQAAEALGFLG